MAALNFTHDSQWFGSYIRMREISVPMNSLTILAVFEEIVGVITLVRVRCII